MTVASSGAPGKRPFFLRLDELRGFLRSQRASAILKFQVAALVTRQTRLGLLNYSLAARQHDFAGVAQLVERQPSKLNVEGSSPFARFQGT